VTDFDRYSDILEGIDWDLILCESSPFLDLNFPLQPVSQTELNTSESGIKHHNPNSKHMKTFFVKFCDKTFEILCYFSIYLT
jgi:hypothetical protein